MSNIFLCLLLTHPFLSIDNPTSAFRQSNMAGQQATIATLMATLQLQPAVPQGIVSTLDTPNAGGSNK
jgi:hypothetical protein